MSETRFLLGTLDFICPHCEEWNEIDDIEVSITIWGTDVGRMKDECVFEYGCKECGREFRVTPHMDINVEKMEK